MLAVTYISFSLSLGTCKLVYSTLVSWYICIYPSLFPVTLWELEVAQGVPKSERESWLLESVETLLTCGDPINMWRPY